MRLIGPILFNLCCGMFVFGQHPISFVDLDSNQIKKHVYELASDSYAGRATGDSGQWKATAYLEKQLAASSISFPPQTTSYLQHFPLYKKQKSGYLVAGSDTLSFPHQVGFLNFFQSVETDIQIDAVFSSIKKAKKNLQKGKNQTWLIQVRNFSEIDIAFWNKQELKQVIFSIKEYQTLFFSEYSIKGLVYPEENSKLPILFVPRSVAAMIEHNMLHVHFNFDKELVSTANVAGFIPGTDSLLNKEVIVLSAHYDHVGIIDGKIHNGADDNASGTATLLEIGRILEHNRQNGNGLKRSVLLLFVSAEEIGLYGSRYYVEHPLIPLKQTVVDLNIDMIGRITDSNETKQHFTIHVIGSDVLSEDLHQWNEQVNQDFTQLRLDYTLANLNHPMRLYYRSDHYNFAKNGIPSIFYFGGFHSDYHQPSDDADLLNYTKIHRVGKLVLELTKFIGNQENRPVLK